MGGKQSDCDGGRASSRHVFRLRRAIEDLGEIAIVAA